jgi:hypothetical protein
VNVLCAVRRIGLDPLHQLGRSEEVLAGLLDAAGDEERHSGYDDARPEGEPGSCFHLLLLSASSLLKDNRLWRLRLDPWTFGAGSVIEFLAGGPCLHQMAQFLPDHFMDASCVRWDVSSASDRLIRTI